MERPPSRVGLAAPVAPKVPQSLAGSRRSQIGFSPNSVLHIFRFAAHWRCNRSAKLDMVRFGAKFGLDHGSLAPDIVPKLNCTRCGRTDIGLTRQPQGNECRRPEEKPVNAYLTAKGG